MQQSLKHWGYEASREACRARLKRYRMGVGNPVDGNSAVYVLSRHDLMRWYHVDGLGADALHIRYLKTHGVHAC